MTVRVAILVLGLAGCDSVFGLHRPPIDAADVDAPPPDAPVICVLEKVPGQASVGNEIAGIAAGQLTEDNHVDLVVAGTAGFIEVLPGNGDGTFGTSTRFGATGGGTRVVAVEDFDGNGQPDIVVSNASDNELAVFVRSGPSFFVYQEPAAFAPTAIAIGRLDADPRFDLAATNTGGTGSITIHRGNSSGTFEDYTELSSNGIPVAVAIADLNGDLKADMIIGTAEGYARVYVGTGTGAFAAPIDLAMADPKPTAVVAAPFGDGAAIDLAFVGERNRINVYTNDGNGGMSGPVYVPVGTSPIGMIAVDITQDGLRDIVTANNLSGTLSILAGAADGTFTARPDAPGGNTPTGLVSADFNADGRPDLAVANGTSGMVTVLLNRCTP